MGLLPTVGEGRAIIIAGRDYPGDLVAVQEPEQVLEMAEYLACHLWARHGEVTEDRQHRVGRDLVALAVAVVLVRMAPMQAGQPAVMAGTVSYQ
jgi:hypothetical protein